MEDGLHDLFVFGDDFEAVLDILEEDEGISEHFMTAVRDVSRNRKRFSTFTFLFIKEFRKHFSYPRLFLSYM